MKKLFLSIDVEEWFRAENIREYLSEGEKRAHSSAYALDLILDLLERTNSRATLFVVSQDIPAYRNQLKRALKLGCELASHTHDHTLLTTLNYEKTHQQLYLSKQIIEQQFSCEVKGFRSPCFSVNRHLDKILTDTGYLYSSNNIEASMHDRYGGTKFKTGNITDIEIPHATFANFKYPITGGGWFRLFPLKMQLRALERSTENNVFYCHPWDFDIDQPSCRKIPPLKRFRHAVGTSKALGKLEGLIRQFDCNATLGELFNEQYN